MADGARGQAPEQGAPPLADLEFIHESETTNLYVCPEAADYPRELGPAWRRLDSCVRETDSEDFAVPPGEGALVYFSPGSLGSADVELMRRVIGVLAKTSHATSSPWARCTRRSSSPRT